MNVCAKSQSKGNLRARSFVSLESLVFPTAGAVVYPFCQRTRVDIVFTFRVGSVGIARIMHDRLEVVVGPVRQLWICCPTITGGGFEIIPRCVELVLFRIIKFVAELFRDVRSSVGLCTSHGFLVPHKVVAIEEDDIVAIATLVFVHHADCYQELVAC
jgi:hypothetical protein